MGVAIPNLLTEDRVSGAQIVDGSLRFDSGKGQYLKRTLSSSGNRQTWTWSGWVKKASINRTLLLSTTFNGLEYHISTIESEPSDSRLGTYDRNTSNVDYYTYSAARLRDRGWYHIVMVWDTSNSTQSERIRTYINGVRTVGDSGSVDLPTDTSFTTAWNNSSLTHHIGMYNGNQFADAYFSQIYFIDGQALDSSYFGYTDPLTNTWRPKKFKPQATPNYGATWSNNWTASGNGFGSNPVSNIFDSSSANFMNNSNGGQIVTWNTSSYTLGGRLRVYGYSSSGLYDIYVNGTKAADTGSSLAWIDCGTFSSITEIQFAGTTYNTANGLGSAGIYVYLIEINGVPLLDNDTINMGANGFFLPFDGSAPIGQDQSGRGNNWTPVNFGGSNTLEKATGALPILNTDGGGNVARPGVFGSEVGAYYTVTTANGSVYQFDITSGDNPSISFIRGATYKFDYSSHTGHPLLFSSTNPDSSTTAYTDGTSIANNVISFTVPHNAPDTLYYYCSNHPTSMNGSISVVTDTKKADIYAWKNVLALPLVGSANDISNQINSGSTAKTVTATNAVASSNASNFYGGSFAFDGTGDYLTVTDNVDTRFGTGDFTVEYWIYYNSISGNPTPFDKGYTGSGLSANGWIIQNAAAIWYGGGSAKVTSPYTDVTGKWYHYAFVRNSGTLTMYRDGVSVISGSDSTDYTYAVDLGIGANIRAGGGFSQFQGAINGYIQDFRIYKGLAKYTQNFIPASTDPDILPDTPSGVAYSSNVALVPSTDGAVAFDGADGTALQLSNHSDIQLGSGTNWTIEFFAYRNGAFVDFDVIAGKGAAGTYEWFIEGFADGSVDILYSANGSTTWTGQHEILSNMALNRWYHIALVRNGSGANNFKAYVDGVQTFQTTAFDIYAGTGVLHIGGYNGAAGQDPPIIISNFRIVNGSSVYTSNFTPPSAPITSVENTKLLCCKSQTSATAADVTPGTITANGNAAATNFNPFTVNINTVRGKQSGYATLNPLNNGGIDLSNGNLGVSNGAAHEAVRSTIKLPSSGKWYAECTLTSASPGVFAFGIDYSNATNPASYVDSNKAYIAVNATLLLIATDTQYELTTTTAGAILMVAYDSGTQNLWLGFNGNWYTTAFATTGNPANGTNPTAISIPNGFLTVAAYSATGDVNFGQKPFKFPPPAGFQPLALANTPRPSIVRPDQYVGVTTYTGNGGTQSINVGFKPDFVWIKDRSTTYDHRLVDSVRGSTRVLFSNQTNTEQVDSYGTVGSFTSNGFTLRLGTTIVGAEGANANGDAHVAWCWKAGGNSNTFNIDDVGYATASAAGLTAGTITPTGASVNTKSGFSIITYTGNETQGATVAHGLQKEPAFIIIKRRTGGTSNWLVGHKSLATNWGQVLYLNLTDGQFDQTAPFNDTAPTSSVWTMWDSSSNNASGSTYVAYLWAEIPGFSKFGSYTGSGSTDGSFIYTGFAVKYLLVKCTNAAGQEWVILDSSRSPYNVVDDVLYANVSDAEGGNSTRAVDFLSNGFKFRNGSSGPTDFSGRTYIYAAFAEAPTFNLYGAQSNAR
jgi:hypothetical protein